MNNQSIYHAYAMTYLELDRARTERKPVPSSVLARMANSEGQKLRAVMRALRDLEVRRPLRSKEDLIAALDRATPATAA